MYQHFIAVESAGRWDSVVMLYLCKKYDRGNLSPFLSSFFAKCRWLQYHVQSPLALCT